MKSESRVSKFYEKGTDDWKAQYNMLLPDGKSCTDCKHANKCLTLFKEEESNTRCQFYPNAYEEKKS